MVPDDFRPLELQVECGSEDGAQRGRAKLDPAGFAQKSWQAENWDGGGSHLVVPYDCRPLRL